MTKKSVTESNAEHAEAPRRRRRKEARPAEIIAAGMQEFALRGFAGTRLEDVARRAGIAKGTIYLYFEDKEALFMAAVRERVGPAIDEVAGFVDGFPGPTRELLRLVIPVLHERLVQSDLHTILRIMIGEGSTFPGLTALYYRETVLRGRELLERIVARGRARGEIREGAAADLPLVIMAPAIMSAIWQMTFMHEAPIPPERFLAAHLDLITEGLLVPEAGR
ncbi:MAG: TetR/AcrR family transcriptional regulator [Beijerinckiaceae bacterium]|nr:TetR/AcrR family transcriptional regulator [Beijerinckiaceae bacterium]MCZ8300061.1 TetR/AcrR family transcriptional regulator [Beijerinckiaceae bacterium]